MKRKKRVLFVCIGNICRSPMAEALARKYGSDVIDASSAGLSPALNTQVATRAVLAEKNIDLGAHMPRRYRDLSLKQYDLVVNMSGHKIADPGVPMETWDVKDPYGFSDDMYRETRELLEMLVMHLILRIRTGKL